MRAIPAALALLVGTGACEESSRPASVTRERSQAIESQPQLAAQAPATTPATSARAAEPKRPRTALCQGQLREGRALPKQRVSRASASSELEAPSTIASAGRWTWVNFWAAWCAPCKEEIPRLKSWETQLAQKRLRVVFVSLDDDKRQLMQFLGESSELKHTFWLREGKERDEWMSAAGLGDDPELPFHLLVDPENKVRCRIQGAVEDRDLADLADLLEAG
jgi:thiol-disulfide isomerase/thioredoxin